MTDKELKRLNRAELLELLLVQTKEVERLRHELAEARQELADRRLGLRKAGNLAQAVLAVNGVMEAAQAAANQYLENIAALEAEARERFGQLLLEAETQEEALPEQNEKPLGDPDEISEDPEL
ncbi:MAG: hypothetical protein IJ422_04550 [Oscillospiraceae bacterium]|nr:hypothetical protein [Oscillospiraceae bacterium]